MGIKNFTKFIREKFPQVLIPFHISEFCGKKIGIESHLFLYKFKCAQFSNNNTNKNNNWKTQFMYFLISLRKYNVHPVIILEGNIKPNAKSDTVKQRIENREKVKRRIQLLHDLKNILLKKQDVPKEICLELQQTGQNIQIFPELYKKISSSSFEYHSSSDEDNDKIDKNNDDNEVSIQKMTKRDLLLSLHPSLKIINDEIEKLTKRTVSVCNEDIDFLKSICDGLGIPYIQAPCEAEAYLCGLLKAKAIDGVMTDDSDVCAYGCDMWITKYTYKQYNENGQTNTAYKISTTQLMNEMGIDESQFLDLCIMSGTDYCENPKGLGCVKLLKIIKEEKDKYKQKFWNEEYEDAKNIFQTQGVFDTYPKIEWCKIPSVEKLEKMMNHIGCKDSSKKILNNLQVKIIMEK